VIDRRGPIVVGAACIGHAFKFSPVLGELFADLAEERPLPPEARRFSLERPTLAPERRHGRVAVGA
jgi:sarcosine oxidase